MREFTEKRGRYNIKCYEIIVDKKMKNDALDFAERIIKSNNQYSRLYLKEIKNPKDKKEHQTREIQRTYMGKLGEISFLKFLQEKNKIINATGMLEIYEGQNNVDDFDFITATQNSVDVKTGFRKVHKRLLVNVEQFNNIPKDFYVAVKLDAIDIDKSNKLVDLDSVSTAKILGYSDYEFMKKETNIDDFGEGPARWIYYNRLMGIDKLLEKFEDV